MKEFYTPTAAQRFASETQDGQETGVVDIKKQKSGKKLVDNLSSVFLRTNTNVFSNDYGLESLHSPANRKAFEQKMAEVVSAKCGDLFSDAGKIKPEKISEWENVSEIAPKISEILLDLFGNSVFQVCIVKINYHKEFFLL